MYFFLPHLPGGLIGFQNKSPGSGVLQRLQSGYLSLSVVPLQKLSNVGIEVAEFHRRGSVRCMPSLKPIKYRLPEWIFDL
jgi:hypothetical protein